MRVDSGIDPTKHFFKWISSKKWRKPNITNYPYVACDMLRDALLLGLAGEEQLVVVQVCRPVVGSFRSKIHKMVEVVDTGILPFGPCSPTLSEI